MLTKKGLSMTAAALQFNRISTKCLVNSPLSLALIKTMQGIIIVTPFCEQT